MSNAVVIAPEALLAHWQGHRRVTRRVIAAFPGEEFSSLSIGGMRPFSELTSEMLGMTIPTAQGVLTNEWKAYEGTPIEEMLEIKTIDQSREAPAVARAAVSGDASGYTSSAGNAVPVSSAGMASATGLVAPIMNQLQPIETPLVFNG